MQAWEERLPQASDNGSFSFMGALRCEQPAEVLVGVRMRRGVVLDQIQIAYATVMCQCSTADGRDIIRQVRQEIKQADSRGRGWCARRRK
jgi:hypothetical protein